MIGNDEKIETYHIYVTKEEAPVVDSTPPINQPSRIPLVSLCLFAVLAIGTLAILPGAPATLQQTSFHTLTLPSLQVLGVTMHQSLTVATTGKGHQQAQAARGFLTFYNGAFQAQTIPANMIFTAANGVHIVTDEAVTIPSANPPVFGQATISAHSLQSGTRGNIPAYGIDTACCFGAMKVVNVDAFSGGRNARDYHTVRQQDIDNVNAIIAPTLYHQLQKALQSGLTPDAAFIALPCSTKGTSNHHAGEEAASVKVTVTETCTSVVYSRSLLLKQALELAHVPVGYVSTRVEIHVLSSLVDSQKNVKLFIIIIVRYNGITRKGWIK